MELRAGKQRTKPSAEPHDEPENGSNAFNSPKSVAISFAALSPKRSSPLKTALSRADQLMEIVSNGPLFVWSNLQTVQTAHPGKETEKTECIIRPKGCDFRGMAQNPGDGGAIGALGRRQDPPALRSDPESNSTAVQAGRALSMRPKV